MSCCFVLLFWSKKIYEKVVPSLANKAAKEFENSLDDVNRSVMILYRGGLMSKAKYNSILSSLMRKTGVDSKKERCRLNNGQSNIAAYYWKVLSHDNFP